MKTLINLVSWACAMFAFTLFFSTVSFAQNSPTLTDPQIASVALTANQIDVDYALIAQKKSKNAEILRFAQTMKDDHLGVIDMATKLANRLGVTPMTNDVTKSLLEGAETMKATLNSKSGKAFNKAYIDNEVTYHEAVIGAVETVLIPQSQNEELKALLVNVLPALKVHLQHARMVQSNLK